MVAANGEDQKFEIRTLPPSVSISLPSPAPCISVTSPLRPISGPHHECGGIDETANFGVDPIQA